MKKPDDVAYAILRGIADFVRTELRATYGPGNVKVRLTGYAERIDAEVKTDWGLLRFSLNRRDGTLGAGRSIWQSNQFELADPASFDDLSRFLNLSPQIITTLGYQS